MHEIKRATAEELLAAAKGLAGLLVDTVAAGASVGFLAPLDPEAAANWWAGLAPEVSAGATVLWLALEDGEVLGTVQLRLADKPNSRHRADVAKLIVHPRARGRGLGRELLATAERGALAAGRSTLVLDTETGSPAEGVYRSAGWIEVGVIPDYATDAAGRLKSTTYFYKLLR
ncbi:GNAT family N-acetyltransferase [Kutzneria albida]|uniref:N-acetyltransferase domain-containing protein n=1 Tax=Kutzneria albida DSM 43870 TaxID=1449976 RepID=W5W3C0_9PSEU|nr:GNAT family N-acetyltransferase [Kutzneria albida]AHH95688.1 hypothetical protein KALB_2320 [Kutzneria albida DSM 43870]